MKIFCFCVNDLDFFSRNFDVYELINNNIMGEYFDVIYIFFLNDMILNDI